MFRIYSSLTLEIIHRLQRDCRYFICSHSGVCDLGATDAIAQESQSESGHECWHIVSCDAVLLDTRLVGKKDQGQC